MLFIGVAILIAIGLALLIVSDAGTLVGLEQAQFGQLVALVVILLLVASGLFTRRHRLGEMLGNVVLWAGIFGIVIASIVNLFLHSGMMGFVISCAAVLVFGGLTAYDTQKLRQMHAASGYSSSAALPISGALTLYLDFINLFLALLRLFGNRRN